MRMRKVDRARFENNVLEIERLEKEAIAKATEAALARVITQGTKIERTRYQIARNA